MAGDFTKAGNDVFAVTCDVVAKIPDGFSGGALDFAASLFGWVIYKLTCYVKYVGPAVLVIITLSMMLFNRRQIIKSEKESAQS